MMICGVDPGVTGAIALICSTRGLLECEDLPVCANGMATGKVTRWLDVDALVRIVKDWSARHDFARDSVLVAIERPIPMPSLPSTTTASSFDTFGALRAVLGMLAGPVTPVTPREWKAFYALGTDKNESRAKAAALYPMAPVKQAKHHNRAEAILIAHWHMRATA